MMLSKLLINFVLTLVVLSGCAGIPLDSRFVSVQSGLTEVRQEGTCREDSFKEKGHLARGATGGLSPDSIPLLDWNIYKGQQEGWQSDLLRYGNKSDLILLQEALTETTLLDFFRNHGFNWNFNSAFRYQGSESGVLTASKVVPLQSCGLRVKEPIIRLPKTIVVSSFSIAGKSTTLLVANVHAINFTLGTGAYRQQFEELQTVLQGHDGPMLVVGDFNNWREKRSIIVNKLAEALSLTVLPFEKDDKRTTFFGDPVDHILYRGVEPVAFTVYPVTSSDHNPISVEFRLKESK